MPLPKLITFARNSTALICWHEAGHAWASMYLDAFAVEVELVGDPPTHGRTRIPGLSDEDPSARRTVAAAGIAAEHWLFRNGRLVRENGQPLDPNDAADSKHFIDGTIGTSAASDKVSFFGEDRKQADGFWPKECDEEFAKLAVGLSTSLGATPVLVEAIAEALFDQRRLDRAALVKLARATQDR